MERRSFRSTSLIDILAEVHERDLLREANARRRAARPDPQTRVDRAGFSILGRRFLG
jgi:hypothetical protein